MGFFHYICTKINIMENKDKTYTIRNISEKQLRTIEKALDAYTRVGLMQFENVINDIFNWERLGLRNDKISQAYIENRDVIDTYLGQVRKLLVSNDESFNLYPLKNWSLGIGNKDLSPKVNIAYEIEKDISIGVFNDRKGKLRFSDETETIVEEDNQRLDKIIKILEKRK